MPWRWLFASLGVLILAGLVAPYITADRFGTRIREGLERGLQRKVEIGKVRFNLFSGPGFTVEDVLIYDDPSAGIEPFAHMLELDARVRLSALLAGRIEFARLRFVEPSINIVKPEHAPWNVVPLLQQTVKAGAALQGVGTPEIQITDGRIFFKFQETKSSFYFLNASVVIAPRDSEKGAFLINFSGEPARTDALAIGSGEFKAVGRLLTGLDAESRLEMELTLDNGDVEDIIALAQGRSIGIHGRVESKARLWGPLSELKMQGTLTVEDVHRWDLTPHRYGKTGLQYQGAIDLPAEHFEFRVKAAGNPGLPVDGRVSVDHALSNPSWTAELATAKLPASAVVSTALQLGIPLPTEMTVHGSVAGLVAYTTRSGLQGQLTTSDGSVKLPGGPEFQLAQSAILISNREVRLTSATPSGDGREAELEAVYTPVTQHFEAIVRGQSLRIADLKRQGGARVAALPLVNHLTGGTWSGWIRCVSEPGVADAWTASLMLRNSRAQVPGIAEPLDIRSADVELTGANLRMRRLSLAAGPLTATGEYGYEVEGNRHTFRILADRASAADFERLLAPSLGTAGSQDNFFTRNLRWPRGGVPQGSAMKAEGVLAVKNLTLGTAALENFRTDVHWNGPSVQLSSVSAAALGGSLHGNGSIQLSRTGPAYAFDGELTDANWNGGTINVAGEMETGGSGLDLLLNLKTTGKFQAKGLEIDRDHIMRTVTGDYGFSFSRSGPRLIVSEVQASMGSERFEGQGSTQGDGRLQMELLSAKRSLHLSLMMNGAPRLEVTQQLTQQVIK